MLHTDPYFLKGTNSCTTYNNSGNGTVTIARQTKSSDNPITSATHELVIQNTGTASPGYGGYFQDIQSRANAIFVRRIIAKVPVGYTIQAAENSMGSGYSREWLTDQNGTGKFKEYIYKYTCGASGSYSNGGHVYIYGGPAGTTSAPIKWYLAYSTTFDMTDISDVITMETRVTSAETAIEENSEQIALRATKTEVSTLNTNLTNLQTRLSTAEASITTNAESIALKATKTEVNAIKATADSANAYTNNAKNNYGYQYKYNLTLNGDPNTYYPIIFKGGVQDVSREILVTRSYGDKAPAEWNGHPSTKGIGLLLKIKCNFGGWGGANYSWCIHDLEEMYGNVFAGAQHCMSSMGFAIFLRGGGTTGAAYTIFSDQAIERTDYMHSSSPQICYESDLIGWSGGTEDNPTYSWNAPAPRTLTQSVIDQIAKKKYITYINTLETKTTELIQDINGWQMNWDKILKSDNANTTTHRDYIEFNNGDIILGESGSDMKLHITNEDIQVKGASNATLAKFGTETIIGNTSGRNLLIDSDSVDIRNGTTTLASFGVSTIYLGKNSTTSVINLCNASATMRVVNDKDFKIYTDKRLVMSAYDSMLMDCYRDSTHMTRIAIQSSDPDVSSVVGGVQFTIYQDNIKNTVRMLNNDIELKVTDGTNETRLNIDESILKMYASDRVSVNSKNSMMIGESSGYSAAITLGHTFSRGKSINCYWSDGEVHDLISQASNGQTSYFGPANITDGSSNLYSTTNIRGKYVRLYNHTGGGVYLGSSGSTAVTSDRNLKKDILDIDNKYIDFFDRLRPITYKYNTPDNKGHRDHIGFIAQEVEEALIDSGLTTEQFAGLVREENITLNPNYDSSLSDEENKANEQHYDVLYSLRYEEFISLLVKKVQNLQKQIDDITNK